MRTRERLLTFPGIERLDRGIVYPVTVHFVSIIVPDHSQSDRPQW